jgi:hypothetical protein
MKGKKTDPQLVEVIRQLRRMHRPAEIVKIMDGRLHRRTVYRILERLRREDEELVKEAVEKGRRMYELEEQQRRERVRRMGVRKYTNVSQFPARLRKVRGS